MSTSVMTAVLDALKADSSLVLFLGSTANIITSHISQAKIFPAVSVFQNTESSKKRVGYKAVKTRDQYSIYQVDVASTKTMQETFEIADLIDILCVGDNIAGTLAWQKVSDSDQFEEDVHVFHKALRYSFQYVITDA